MSEQGFSAVELFRRHREGDPQAAGELFAHYARRLCALAERHLSSQLAGRVDGEDVVQSVFRTFFRRTERGEFKIDSGAQLWQLLVKITVLKAQGQGRRHTAGLRDVRLEQNTDGEWLMNLAEQEPTPEEAAILVEEIEILLQGLPATYCRVLELRLQGYSVAETAREIGLSRMTVYRAVDVMQNRLTKNL